MHIHALVKIIVYLTSIVLLSALSGLWLLLFFLVVVAVSIYLEGIGFSNRFVKLRWLLLSIVLVYGFSVPGEYVSLTNGLDAPVTKEGLVLGLMQAVRLLAAIACLGILFYQSTITQLIGGLRHLLAPLMALGLDVDRFVVRLLLTLAYVDEVTLSVKDRDTFLNLHARVESATAPVQLNAIDVESMSLSRYDYVVLLVIICCLGWLGIA